MSKVRVDVEEVIALQQRLREINSVPFNDIEWHKDDIKLELVEESLEEFKYMGLSNYNFVDMYLS